ASPSYGKPEEVFKTAGDAAAKEDWKALYACFAEISQYDITATSVDLLLGLREKLINVNETPPKQFDTIAAKYGLTKDKLVAIKKEAEREQPDHEARLKHLRTTLAPIKDRPGFFADVMTAVREFEKKHNEESIPGPVLPIASLKDLKVT